MSKHETPLTRRYWKSIGGTLIEEYLAVRNGSDRGPRRLDGLIIRSKETNIETDRSRDITGEDVIVVQTKAKRLSMTLLGQAILSRALLTSLRPRTIHSVAVCTVGDAALEPLAEAYGIEVVVYDEG